MVSAAVLVLMLIPVLMISACAGGNIADVTVVSLDPTTAPTTVVRVATERDYVDAIVDRFADSDIDLSDIEARCVAEGTVALIGVDALRESGITPEGLSGNDPPPLARLLETDADVDSFVDMTLDCVDLGESSRPAI